jgi:hypothetical protein
MSVLGATTMCPSVRCEDRGDCRRPGPRSLPIVTTPVESAFAAPLAAARRRVWCCRGPSLPATAEKSDRCSCVFGNYVLSPRIP